MDPFATGLLGASPSPLARALAAVPELRALALVSEMGPLLALPVEWLGATERATGRGCGRLAPSRGDRPHGAMTEPFARRIFFAM